MAKIYKRIPWNKGIVWNERRGRNHPRWKEKILIKCQQCDKKFEVHPCRRNAKFCSHKCYSKSRIDKPNWNSGKKCPQISEAMKKFFREGGQHWAKGLTKENSKIIRKKSKKLVGHKTSEETKRKIREARKNQRNTTPPTKPEKIIIKLIKKYDLPFKYVGDGKCWVGNLNPDFVNCNGKKQIIEVFGNYWHTQKARSWKEEEFGRIVYYSQIGWKCLVLWENELVNRPKYGEKLSEVDITKKIKEFITSV